MASIIDTGGEEDRSSELHLSNEVTHQILDLIINKLSMRLDSQIPFKEVNKIFNYQTQEWKHLLTLLVEHDVAVASSRTRYLLTNKGLNIQQNGGWILYYQTMINEANEIEGLTKENLKLSNEKLIFEKQKREAKANIKTLLDPISKGTNIITSIFKIIDNLGN